MARAARKQQRGEATNARSYWQEQIAKACKRWGPFQRTGNLVVDRYRLEKANSQVDLYKDRYNILYSSTETTKPSLYQTTPKVQAVRRHQDRENDTVLGAVMLMETSTQYAMEEIDFDYVMENVVEDFLLPGMGQAWVRYEASFKRKPDAANDDYSDEAYTDDFEAEGLAVDYVHFCDFITGPGRTWNEIPWVARRVYMTKEQATKRFGREKANLMAYSLRNKDTDGSNSTEAETGNAQAAVWEIWNKPTREAIWYSDDYGPDVLDRKADPLKLKNFFPCPRPVRAVANTRTMVPKSFYSQYKAQAEQIDLFTQRIRILSDALKLVGVYDGSQEQLQNLLVGNNNKLVRIDNWAQFAGSGGINGAIQWVPVKEVAEVLNYMLSQREICKNEIYEITGFSDIVRGVSKASETLGAQQIKADWATGRLRSMQKEIQRFCRDVIRIMSEIIAEQFSDRTLQRYAGVEIPPETPQEQQAKLQAIKTGQQLPVSMHDQALQQWNAVVKLLREEKQRCAQIGIETDSTILPDEAKEREDRITFLGQVGAFLQQAGPMAMQFPDMRGLLGALMMFVIRTFPASRPLEKEFEDFQKKLAAAPPTNPEGEGGEGDSGEAAMQAAQIQAQSRMQEVQVKAQTDTQTAQMKDQTERLKIQTEAQFKENEAQRTHEYRMAELRIRMMELEIKQVELGIRQQEAADRADAEANRLVLEQERSDREDEAQEHSQEMAEQGAAESAYQFDRGQEQADADREAQRAAAGKSEGSEA